MKRELVGLLSLLVFSGGCFAQQTDPVLTGAVAAQSVMLEKIFSDREKTQKKIIAAEAAVTVAMERMHKVLVTTEIPQNMNLVRQSLPGHLKGTAIAMLVSDELTDAATQMASLYPFMKQLVTSGSYNVSDYDEKGNPVNKKHKVNLLNSAERYYVANEVVTKLEDINTDLWLLAWQIRTFSWNDLWYGLDPDGWATVMSGKAIVEGLIYEWQYL